MEFNIGDIWTYKYVGANCDYEIIGIDGQDIVFRPQGGRDPWGNYSFRVDKSSWLASTNPAWVLKSKPYRCFCGSPSIQGDYLCQECLSEIS